jgi:hypothetical protein
LETSASRGSTGTGMTLAGGSLALVALASCALPTGLAAVVLILLAMLVAVRPTSRRALQVLFVRWSRHRARREREASRLRLLSGVTAEHRSVYCGLYATVERITQDEPSTAARLELEDLLDHYVRGAAEHQRLLLASQCVLAHRPLSLFAEHSTRRDEIYARRERHRKACSRRCQELGEDLASISELVYFVAERCARVGAPVELESEIEKRLWELDELDASLAQLHEHLDQSCSSVSTVDAPTTCESTVPIVLSEGAKRESCSGSANTAA